MNKTTWEEIIKRIHHEIDLISQIDEDSGYPLGFSCGLMAAEQIINGYLEEENEYDNEAN